MLNEKWITLLSEMVTVILIAREVDNGNEPLYKPLAEFKTFGRISLESLSFFENSTNITLPPDYKEFMHYFGEGELQCIQVDESGEEEYLTYQTIPLLSPCDSIIYPSANIIVEYSRQVNGLKELLLDIKNSQNILEEALEMLCVAGDSVRMNNALTNIESIKKMEELLDSCMVFSISDYDITYLWDLSSFALSDMSYDIYMIKGDMIPDTVDVMMEEKIPFVIKVGRTFFEFVEKICLQKNVGNLYSYLEQQGFFMRSEGDNSFIAWQQFLQSNM
jgi:hypothetical protein